MLLLLFQPNLQNTIQLTYAGDGDGGVVRKVFEKENRDKKLLLKKKRSEDEWFLFIKIFSEQCQ